MSPRHCLLAIAILGCLAFLSGCNTDDELDQQRLGVLKAEADSLDALKKDLGAQAAGGTSVFEGPGTVSIFLSKNLINAALKGLSGVTIALPSVDGATLTIKSVTADLKLGYPLVTIDAEAAKRDLGLTLQVVGTARLETKIDSTGAPKLIITVQLEDLVPRAQWGFFDFKIGGFVRSLIKEKASNALSNLAAIQMPIATEIPLILPANQMPVSFPGAKALVNTPAMTVSGHAAVSRILVLPDGLHVYGTLTAKVG